MFVSMEKSSERKVVSCATKPCGKISKQSLQTDDAKKAAVSKCLFPKYDNCKSLLLFPSIFTSCLNSGDFGSLSKLIKSRTDKHCHIDLFGHQMTVDTAVRVFELLDELHPDSVYTLQGHKHAGDSIDAAIHFKYTSSRSIIRSIKSSIQDQQNLILCPEPQSNPSCLIDYFASKPAENQVALLTQIYTAEELLVRGLALMTMQIDSHTKKITQLVITCHFSSFDVLA